MLKAYELFIPIKDFTCCTLTWNTVLTSFSNIRFKSSIYFRLTNDAFFKYCNFCNKINILFWFLCCSFFLSSLKKTTSRHGWKMRYALIRPCIVSESIYRSCAQMVSKDSEADWNLLICNYQGLYWNFSRGGGKRSSQNKTPSTHVCVCVRGGGEGRYMYMYFMEPHITMYIGQLNNRKRQLLIIFHPAKS